MREPFAKVVIQAWRAAFSPVWRAQARRQRKLHCGSYIAVIGSCGKSTATMLLGHLLSCQAATATGARANTGPYVLRSMRKLDHRVEYFVQELSEYPLDLFPATIATIGIDAALLTTIGLDHRTEFRTNEAIAEQMALVLRSLPQNGIACLNIDQPHIASLLSTPIARVVTYGRSPSADVRVEDLRGDVPLGLRFNLTIDGKIRAVETRFVGTLFLPSIVGALAMVHALGRDIDKAIAELRDLEPLANRMSLLQGTDGHTYVIDTFKASYWSTKLLIEDVKTITSGRRILVLGEVSDMGSDSSKKYRQLVRSAAAFCDLVIGLDRAADAIERVSRNEKLTNLRSARSLSEVAMMLASEPPAVVVMKGSKLTSNWAAIQRGAIAITPTEPVA